MIKDNGNRVPMGNTGFVRDCKEGVGRMDLLPWRAIIEVSKHCEEGAKKYGERNIDKGCPQHSLIDSAFRHLAKYTIGMTDEDHLRACAWNILWALEQEVSRPDMQDIPAVRLAQQLREMNGGKDLRSVEDGDDRRCVEHTCYYNNDCQCTSPTETWNPDFGEKCPDYSED